MSFFILFWLGLAQKSKQNGMTKSECSFPLAPPSSQWKCWKESLHLPPWRMLSDPTCPWEAALVLRDSPWSHQPFCWSTLPIFPLALPSLHIPTEKGGFFLPVFWQDFGSENRGRLPPALGDSQLAGRRGDMKEVHKLLDVSGRAGWESLPSLFSSYLEKGRKKKNHPTQSKGK